MQAHLVARGKSRSSLGKWSSLLIAGAVVVAAAIIYQVGLQGFNCLVGSHVNSTSSVAAALF
jgi:hypothetical protein